MAKINHNHCDDTFECVDMSLKMITIGTSSPNHQQNEEAKVDLKRNQVASSSGNKSITGSTSFDREKKTVTNKKTLYLRSIKQCN